MSGKFTIAHNKDSFTVTLSDGKVFLVTYRDIDNLISRALGVSVVNWCNRITWIGYPGLDASVILSIGDSIVIETDENNTYNVDIQAIANAYGKYICKQLDLATPYKKNSDGTLSIDVKDSDISWILKLMINESKNNK